MKKVLIKAIKSKYFILFCLISALGLHLAWIYLVRTQPAVDCLWFFQRATGIAEGKGYIWDNQPTAFWPIGYPAFLGLLFYIFGPSLWAAKIANIFLYLGIIYLSYYLSKALFQSEITGRVTIFILTINPVNIAYSSLVASEMLYSFLILLGTTLLVETNSTPQKNFFYSVISGTVFGLCVLVKPQTILIPSIFFIVLHFKKICWQKIKSFLALFFVFNMAILIPIIPWTIRNYQIFGKFVFISTNSGHNLLIGNNPQATGRWMKIYNIFPPLVDFSKIQNETEKDTATRKRAIEFIKQNPNRFLELIPKKIKYLFASETDVKNWNKAGLTNNNKIVPKWFDYYFQLLHYYYRVLLGAIIISLAFLLYLRSDNKIIFPSLGLWFALYITLVSVVFFGMSRFHFPLMPFLIMYVAFSLVQLSNIEIKTE